MAAKDKGETALNMTPAELKLIALGTRFSEGGKINYEQVAKYGGYTKGSAQVMYRKALRKLTDAFPIEEDRTSAFDNAANDPATPSAKAKTPNTPKSRTSGRKRKDVVTPQTPLTPGNDIVYEIGDIELDTPTKKPKKATGKQATSPLLTSKTDYNDAFLKDEPLFEPVFKME